jgi:hypothetical protein
MKGTRKAAFLTLVVAGNRYLIIKGSGKVKNNQGHSK